MVYYLRLLDYNRWPVPNYKPIWPDVLQEKCPTFEQGQSYRIRLIGSSDDKTTWPEFVVVDTPPQQVITDPNHPGHIAILVEVCVVLLAEYETFVEPWQLWELN